MHLLQGLPGLVGGGAELVVAGLLLLQALDVGRQLVRRLHQLLHLRVRRGQQAGVDVLEPLGQHPRELPAGDGLHLLIGVPDIGVIIFDGRGHIAGENLAGVVVQGRHGHGSGVHLAAEILVAQHCQGVGQDSHLVAVLLDILGVAVAHQGPAVNEPHPGHIGEKVVHHCTSPNRISPSVPVILTGST